MSRRRKILALIAVVIGALAAVFFILYKIPTNIQRSYTLYNVTNLEDSETIEAQLDVHLQYNLFRQNSFSGFCTIKGNAYGWPSEAYPNSFLASVKQKFNLDPTSLHFSLVDNSGTPIVIEDSCTAYLSTNKKSFALWKDGAFYCGPAANSQEALKLYEKEFQGKID